MTYDDTPGDAPGAGTPVVLLHPFPFDRRYWARTAAALASAGRRVLTLDARGFGESDVAGPFAITDLADDLAALLDGLGVAAAAVVGLSMGGYVALAFAQRHPARLAALVLADTRAGADSAEARRGRADAIALIRDSGADTYLQRSLPRLLAPGAPAAVLSEARGLAETRAERLIAGLEALRDRPDRSAELSAIHCPALVLAGAQDQVVPADEMRAMSVAISAASAGPPAGGDGRGARFTALAGAGHLSSLEAPAPFLTAVREFLDEVTPG